MTQTSHIQAFNSCEHLIQNDRMLAGLTTFKIGGPAEFYAAPETIEEAKQLIDFAHSAEISIRLLGGGSNILVSDEGVTGLVLHLKHLRWCEVRNEQLHVGPGYSLPRLAKLAAKQGIAGFDRFAGIPGYVGGMLRTNSGGRHGTLSDVLHSVALMRPDGKFETRRTVEFEFGHRTSNLRDEFALDFIFNIRHDSPDLLWERHCEIMKGKIASQPLNEKNAGCIFRNPPGDHAARLIDISGLKGHRIGGARVSPDHANFICNESEASASDVLQLIDHVRETVFRETGIELELEVIRWP